MSTTTVAKPAAKIVQIPKQNAAAPAAQIAGMPENDADKLYWMAKNNVFTMRELLSMIGDDSKYPQYVAEGLARMAKMKNPPAKAEKPKPEVKPAPQATVTEAAASALSMEGTSAQTVVMYGRGYGHGVGFPTASASRSGRRRPSRKPAGIINGCSNITSRARSWRRDKWNAT